MKVKKLTIDDKNDIIHLFEQDKFMGVPVEEHGQKKELIAYYMHNLFSNTYLSDLKSYHVFGAYDDVGRIVCILAFYVSSDDASWYWTHIKNVGPESAIKECLDAAIEFNEKNGYYKFYSMFPKKYQRVYRRLAFSKKSSERYDAFDEYYVSAREQCKFNLAWQVLYNRRLVPVDTVVRLSYLKPEFRYEVNGGNL